MNIKRARLSASVLLLAGAIATGFSQTIIANTTANNGGSAGWAMFFDLTATGTALSVTSLTTASTAAAGASFNIEVFTRAGTALGGPVASGPGSSTAGWTSLGTVSAIQGPVLNDISLPIDIPDIAVGNGSTVGVALLFSGAGPRYFGTGTPAYTDFSDGTLTVRTGDARTAPFTTTGSFFTSRALTGSVTYAPVPEPATLAALGFGAIALLRRRQKKA